MDANRTDIFNPLRAEFHKARYAFAAKYIKGKRVIDSASGLGYGADLMMREGNPEKIVGVEINQMAAAYARKNYGQKDRVEFIRGSILDLPFEDNSFDVFTSFETIEHIEDEAGQFAQIKRVLKPNGLYILSTPNDWDNEADKNHFHLRDYDYHSIKKAMEENFELLEIWNQNSGGNQFKYNHNQPAGIIKTTDENYKLAECFILVARNRKG